MESWNDHPDWYYDGENVPAFVHEWEKCPACGHLYYNIYNIGVCLDCARVEEFGGYIVKYNGPSGVTGVKEGVFGKGEVEVDGVKYPAMITKRE